MATKPELARQNDWSLKREVSLHFALLRNVLVQIANRRGRPDADQNAVCNRKQPGSHHQRRQEYPASRSSAGARWNWRRGNHHHSALRSWAAC